MDFSRCNIALDFIVQCNIFSLTGVAGTIWGSHWGKPGKGTTHGEEFRRSADGRQRERRRDPEVLWRAHQGGQAIAVELADYSKKAFEDGSSALEKLLGVKSLDKAIEVQTEYAKTAYEGFVAEATKLGELYTDLAKETYKPFEGMFARAK